MPQALPSEGGGHTFESCRARHFTILHDIIADRRPQRRIEPPTTHTNLARGRPAALQKRRLSRAIKRSAQCVAGNVHSYQKKCDKTLYYLTTDGGAPCALYRAISGRWSAPRRSCSILRQAAIGQKPGQAEREQFRADLAQLISRVFVDRRCSSFLSSNSGAGTRPGRPVPIGR